MTQPDDRAPLPTPLPDKQNAPQASLAVRAVAYVVLPLLVVSLLALAAEGVVRLRQWIKHGTTGSYTELYRTDDRIGLRVLRPNLHIGGLSTNSMGFRGPEITQPKPQGTVRLAFLGASTTYCAEVSSDAMVWPQLVVDELRRRYPATSFDFVNGGVPGYTVASSLKNLRHRVAALQPDLIVVYHATNDLSGEVNRLAQEAGLAVAHGGPGWLERHSLLWELVTKNLRVRAALNQEKSGVRRLQVEPSRLGADFRQALESLLKEAKVSGARVAVATFATHLRQEQSPAQKERAAVSALVYMPFMSMDGLLAGYARFNEVIKDAARAEGALLIDGEDRIPGDPVHFVDSVHFTDQGSRAMADRVVAALDADPAVRKLVDQHRRR